MTIPHPHDQDEPSDDRVKGTAVRGDISLHVLFTVTPGFKTPDGWEPPGLEFSEMALWVDGIDIQNDADILEALKFRGIELDDMIAEARQEAREG